MRQYNGTGSVAIAGADLPGMKIAEKAVEWLVRAAFYSRLCFLKLFERMDIPYKGDRQISLEESSENKILKLCKKPLI